MQELDLLGGLADIEEQLRAGNALHKALAEQIKALGAVLLKLPAPQVQIAPAAVSVAAPQVSVPVTVQPAAAQWDQLVHEHIYDEVGRCVRTVTTRVNKEG